MRLVVAVAVAVCVAGSPARAAGETASATYVGAGPVICSPAGISYAGGCFELPDASTSVNIEVIDPLGQRQLSELAFYAQPVDPLTGQPQGEPIRAEQFCGEAIQVEVPPQAETLVVRVKTINEDEGVMACPVVPTTGEIRVEFRVP